MADYYVDRNGNISKKKKKKNEADYHVDSSGKITQLSKPTQTEDIAPVKGGNKNSVFKSGGFSDGVDGVGDFFVDLGQTVLGTAGDVGVGLGKGVTRLVEGVSDLAGYAASGVASLVGDDRLAGELKRRTQESLTDNLWKGAEDYVDQYSVLGDKADAVSEGLGQVGAIILTGGIGAGAGLGAAGTTALTTGIMGASGMGSGMSEAYAEGADDLEAVTYGAISGAADAATELIFGGLGKSVKALGLSTGLSSADDMLAKKVSGMFTKQISKNFAEFGIKAGAEGVEEVLAGIIQDVGKNVTYLEEEDQKTLWEILTDEARLEEFVVGAVTSGIAQSGVIPSLSKGSLKEATKTGRDFISGYTQNEQAVIDKEVENRVNGRDLTAKEKNKIIKEVQEDLEKGNISTDTIEALLGGETYKAYNSLVEQEKSLKKDLDALGQASNNVINVKKYDEVEMKLKQLRDGKLANARKQLTQEMDTITQKDSFLRNSYLENTKRGQKFTADTSKYEGKGKEFIQKVVDKGYVNNTTKTHDYFDLVAKVSTDTDTSFDVATNNEIMEMIKKKEGKNFDASKYKGKIVDGFFSDDGSIVLNLDSPKALNFLVGHEVTHRFEKSGRYDNLKKAIMEYAQAKKGFQEKYDATKDRYTGIYAQDNSFNDKVDKEFVADVVGEFFTDSDFIENLSTKHRNVFEWLYDEIKHLLKMATAGSKEARMLERAKHEFEKVYRAGSNNQVDFKTDTEPVRRRGGNVGSEKVGFNDVGNVGYSVSEQNADVQTLEGGAVTKYSLSTWTPDVQEKVRNNLVKAGFSDTDVDKWIKDTNGIAQAIANDKARLDFEAHDNHTMVKDNGDYYKTVEASTLCAKRLEYQGTFDAIQHRLPNTVITSDMLIELRNMMNEKGYEVPCGACYVESRRRHLGKFASEWLSKYEGEYKPTLDEVTTSDGLEKLRVEHPQAYSDFIKGMSAKGSANPKVVQLRTEYKGEILDITKSEYEKIMKIGGLRLQSFSDFETPHLLDMMQVVHDMASRKFVSQAYTKVPNFAWVMGDTNIKINLSLIPKGTGIDADGNLIFDSKEGMDFEQALRLRDIYSKNVGTITIGINDAQILKSMADDRIDYIIPFHRSGWGKHELEQMGLTSYDDYTPYQKERYIETGKGAPNIDEMSYWDFGKTGKENAETYLNLCAEKGVIPKFDKFLVNNGDGTYSLQPDGSTDGYWKTLINFKMYDNDGVGSPHEAVVPNFNMEEAYRVLDEYEGEANSLPVAKDVVDEFVAKYNNDVAPINKAETDIRYSVSDSDGNELSPAVQKKFQNSKAVDEGGNLKVLYHGTPSGEFTIFDKSKGNVEGDFGSGFYFTDNAGDVERNYEGGGPDFENKVVRLAEQIEADEEIDYVEAVAKAREQLYVGSHKFEVYLNIEKPAIVGETTLLSYEEFASEYDPDDYDSEEDYEGDVEQLISDKIDEIIWEVDRNTDVYSTDGLAEVLWEAVSEGGIGVEELKAKINDLYLEDSEGNLVGNEVTRQIIESLGYDGIIDSTVSSKFRNMGMEEGTTHYIAFKPNQIKSISNQNPTDNPDIRYSLSNKNEEYAPTGNYNVYGKDVLLDTTQDIAPETEVTETPSVDQEDDVPENVVGAPVLNESNLPKTTKENLETKLQDSNVELENIKAHRESASAAYDNKIAKLQAEYDGKKNKDTKVANRILRRIEGLKRVKADVDADYAKRISDIENRIARTTKALDKDYTKKDSIERAYYRINKHLEADKKILGEEFNQRKAEALSEYADKNDFISRNALALYDEISSLKKGVKASKDLGYLFDHGYSWNEIKRALIDVKNYPDKVFNEDSQAEAVIREMLGRKFDSSAEVLAEIDAEYQKQVEELEAEAEQQRGKFRIAEQRRVKQAELSKWAENLIGNTATWVDKKLGISYKVNTLRRNLRDIVRDANGNQDIAKADAIYDELQGKYNLNEAKLNQESNRIKKVYADMKITDAESAYIQMLGEFRHNPDTTLTEDDVKEFYEKNKKHIDEAKVDKAINLARETYDSLLERVNEVLREQGMKEIPYRKGYFPHFTNEKQSFIAKLFNWKTQDMNIPTDIAGLTENFNPNRSWQSFNKERKSDVTDYDFLKGMDAYVRGSLDWIYHIEDIQKRRAFENHIRYVHSDQGVKNKIDALKNSNEYDADEIQKQIELVLNEAGNPLNNFVSDFRTATNTLAGKKSTLDRTMEEMTNRKIYSTMTNLSNRVAANQVVGSISSALTNFIPITQAMVQVNPVRMLDGMRSAIQSYFYDDGAIDKSAFLTNRLRQAENLSQTTWDKIIDKAGFMMEALDNFTSQTIWRAKYNENLSNGMSENEAIKDADQFAESVIAGRSRGNMPTIFDSKNPLIKVLTAFQLEVNNQYQYMFKDAPKDIRTEHAKAKLLKGYASAAIGAYVYNALYSSIVGRDAAFDPIGIIEDLLSDLGLFGDDEEEPADIIMNLTDNLLEEVPFVGGLIGGGRIPISSAMPYDGLYEMFEGTITDIANEDWANLTNEWLNPLYYLAFPVGGGQIRKTSQGLGMFSDDHPISGSYTQSGSLRFPVEDTLVNRVQAGLFGQWANKNAQDYIENGRKPLEEKQIQEFIDVDLPIKDYWEYREGLQEQKTLEDKFDYIADLDLPVAKKNILINNIVEREEDVDMSNYDDFASYEEFDFYAKNPEKFEFLQENGISYSEYNASEESREDYNAIYTWYKNNPEKVTVSKAITDNVIEYRGYVSALNDIKADRDASGKAISGSGKAKKAAYINSLDLDYGQKIILYRTLFDSQEDKAKYNADIVRYLDSREDISYGDMVTILTELGFKVSGNKVTW
jgi:hypothetical protein